MPLNNVRIFGFGRPLLDRVSVLLTVLAGSCLTGLLFWAVCWDPREPLQNSAPYRLILPVGFLSTVLLAWYLWDLLARLARAEDRAHEIESKFHRLLEDIPNIAVQGYDQNRRVFFWNAASERLYGYGREEALGQPLENLIVPPAMRPETIQAINGWIEEGRPIPSSELELLCRDGSLIPVYSSRVVLTTRQGRSELYCLDVDLSEHKRVEAARAQRDTLLELAALIATRLLGEPDPGMVIATCFAQLGQAGGVDRVYLFENHACPQTGELLMSQRHEWCADSAIAQIDNPKLQNLPYVSGGFERWQRILAENLLVVGSVRDFAESERAVLEPRGILSILVAPINVHGEFWGFIGFDDCHRERDWTPAERNILQNIAGNIGEAIARQRAETTSQESEERFRRLADNMRDLVCQIDMSGTILYLSPSYRTVLGYETEALLGRSIFAHVHPEDRKMASAICQTSLAQGEVGQAQFRYRCADGDYLWLEAVGNPLFDTDGKVCGAVVGSRDITERKRVESELRLAVRVFESSREAIVITDAKSRILSVNRAFSDITGYAADEVVGRTPRLLASGRHDRDFYQSMWHAVVTEGHWQGEIWNRRKDGEIYPEWLGITAVYDSQGHLTHYIGIFSDLSERKATADQIEFLVHHDPLTALPNRVLLHDRLERALAQAERQHTTVALLVLDLDRFKLINDSLGHELGDQLLQLVAVRLYRHVREMDTVSRQGSDEFLILLPDTGIEGADRVVGNLLKCLENEPFSIAEHALSITASIGISLYPAHGRDSDSLLKHAGTALDYAKNGGGNTHRFFTASMNVNALERLHLETSLHLALDRGEFLLYYQPQFSLASGLIVGAEALLRWQHPEWGLVAPGRFIPVAEDSGLIVPIGEWVLREACRQARVWQEAGLMPITVAVNLSALQFKRSDLLATVTGTLAENGLTPDCLELELTESILIQDVDSALKVVREMREMGLKLSIDDFGTGYSSLSYLQKLAVHKLKIDQSFVRDLVSNDTDSAAIVRAIIQLAHNLKLLTVAEGVETELQLNFLRDHGCDEIQGYYLGRPSPAVEFARLLAQAVPSAAIKSTV